MATVAEVIELPAGVYHHGTTAFCESWEVWDSLTPEFGWRHREFLVDPETNRPDSNNPRARLHVQRVKGAVTVFPPLHTRGTSTCPACLRGSWTDSNGAHRRCGKCLGTGRIKDAQ